MIIVDSSVWIDFFNGVGTTEVERLDALLGQEAIGIGDLILTEVLQGFRHDKDYKIAKELLTSLDIFNFVDESIAIKSADNFRLLRRAGITVRKTIDVIIATFCIENDFILLHSDKDFKPFSLHLNLRALSST
jgi:predicted nucleic acid-binding protein